MQREANLTINGVVLACVRFAEGITAARDGTPTGEAGNMKAAVRYVVRLFGQTARARPNSARRSPNSRRAGRC